MLILVKTTFFSPISWKSQCPWGACTNAKPFLVPSFIVHTPAHIAVPHIPSFVGEKRLQSQLQPLFSVSHIWPFPCARSLQQIYRKFVYRTYHDSDKRKIWFDHTIYNPICLAPSACLHRNFLSLMLPTVLICLCVLTEPSIVKTHILFN